MSWLCLNRLALFASVILAFMAALVPLASAGKSQSQVFGGSVTWYCCEFGCGDGCPTQQGCTDDGNVCREYLVLWDDNCRQNTDEGENCTLVAAESCSTTVVPQFSCVYEIVVAPYSGTPRCSSSWCISQGTLDENFGCGDATMCIPVN
jgi:hypothetical protein